MLAVRPNSPGPVFRQLLAPKTQLMTAPRGEGRRPRRLRVETARENLGLMMEYISYKNQLARIKAASKKFPKSPMIAILASFFSYQPLMKLVNPDLVLPWGPFLFLSLASLAPTLFMLRYLPRIIKSPKVSDGIKKNIWMFKQPIYITTFLFSFLGVPALVAVGADNISLKATLTLTGGIWGPALFLYFLNSFVNSLFEKDYIEKSNALARQIHQFKANPQAGDSHQALKNLEARSIELAPWMDFITAAKAIVHENGLESSVYPPEKMQDLNVKIDQAEKALGLEINWNISQDGLEKEPERVQKELALSIYNLEPKNPIWEKYVL